MLKVRKGGKTLKLQNFCSPGAGVGGSGWKKRSLKKEQDCIFGIKPLYLNLCKDTINDFQEIFFKPKPINLDL